MILYFKDKIIRWCLVFSIIFNILFWVLVYFRIPIQTEPLALRYNIYTGINLIGPWYNVYFFPLAGLGIIIFNFALAKIIFKKDKLAAHFLVATALICQIILLIFGGLLVMINV